MSLQRLFQPSTVAVIGGGNWCSAVIQQCRQSGFGGELVAVHPTRTEIAGVAAVPSVTDLPFSPDASFIGVNRRASVAVLRSLSDRDAGGAVCFASGFEESDDEDGAPLQAELLEAAGAMSILGPNCYGYINNLDGAALWPDQHGLVLQENGVAILTQSSNIAINLTMQRRGLPIAYLITTGNQAQQDLASVAVSLLTDERVTAIGLHIEGIRNLQEFERFVRNAHARNVTVVALKVGASDEAQSATQSHTASLAGSQAGANALLNRLGVVLVNTLPEFVEALKLLHVFNGLPGGRLASLSCSGGEASLMADAVNRFKRLSLPAISRQTVISLNKTLGPHVSKVNPLDYHTDIWRNQAAMTTVFGAMTGEPFDLTLLILDFPRSDRCDDKDWLIAIDSIAEAAKLPGARVAVVSSLVENLPEHHCNTLLLHGIAPLMEFDTALAAINAVVAVDRASEQAVWPPNKALQIEHSTLVDEAGAKQMLSGFGVKVPVSAVVRSPMEAQAASDRMVGPLVLKGLGVAHKSEAGLVALNLNSADAVLNEANRMSEQTNSWLLETMVHGVIVELLVGVVHDLAHGFVLTVGCGGVLTEILNDSVSLLMPVNEVDVETALADLNIAPLIGGYRGKSSCNLAAIIDQVMALQRFVESHRNELVEVEINPLMCTANDAIAADALLLIEGKPSL